jgi:protein-glutamine gamma-glutamyltransferase
MTPPDRGRRMRPVRAFRSSLYLSLGIAILAMGVAGGDLLPELPLVTGFCLLMLGGAFVIDGRWQLSLRNANLVGMGLAALLGLWAIFQAVRPPIGLTETLPWPASALPYLVPVLMLLIPAKMLRPKHVGDYWTMYALGLLAMALACAMAMDGLFIVLFAAFAVTFVWSLLAFQLYREVGPELADVPLAGGRWRAVRPAIVWAGITGAAAIPLFWATPRSGAEWELAINGRGRTTGLPEGPVDLNTSGPITVNSEKAFDFYVATPAGQPVLDFPGDQRFRSMHLHTYESGRWLRNQSGLQAADRVVTPPFSTRNPYTRMPDLGPGAVQITYVLQPRLGRNPPVADPVAWRAGTFAPILSQFEDGTYWSWVQKPDGTFDGALRYENEPPRYLQVWAPPARPGDGPTSRMPMATGIQYLSRQPTGLSRLKDYTNRVIERLVGAGELPRDVLTDLDSVQNRVRQHHEVIARALERHLAASGEFAYTLDLTRQDKAIDPTEDFLLNTKSGHCQRFATALVLMLRSQGIPSQMVLGYRGCAGRGDGWYEVHEDQAHAWVEVLIPSEERQPPGAAWEMARSEEQVLGIATLTGCLGAWALTLPESMKPMRWITLDPTPSSPDIAGANGNFLDQARQKWDAVLKALLLAYNRESREQAAQELEAWLVEDDGWHYLAGGAFAIAGLVVWRRRARRRAALFAGIPTPIRRLTAALARGGHTWAPGATAREFAGAAGAALAANPVTAAVADVPAQVIASYYAERFGDRAPSAAERQKIDADLRKLELAIA